ncbi:MAG: U32 family peptidase, partial [Clostridia bacterium]|nr:U32 family peptidase [Clostridia bacterium]
MERMKITAGLGSIDDYEAYVKAGADELFAGCVPAAWQKRFGLQTPFNRREVLCSNVQLGSQSELEILSDLITRYKAPVCITVNSPFYPPEEYGFITETMLSLADMGFDSFIIADPGLLLCLHEEGLASRLRLYISGEAGEFNTPAVREYTRLGACRVIFHRKVPVEDMRHITTACGNGIAYEAFAMNEKCHYNGAWCATLHTDDLPPMCRVPYILTDREGSRLPLTQPEYMDVPGISGCGLCTLFRLREA